MTDNNLWKKIDKNTPDNITIRLAYIQENLYWDPDLIWETTGRFIDGKLFSIKHVTGMKMTSKVTIRDIPNFWKHTEKELNKETDLEQIRTMLYEKETNT